MDVDPRDPGEEDRAREMLAAAEQNFHGLMRALVTLRRELEAGDAPVSDSELRRTLSGIHKAIQVVFDERRKLDEIRRSRAGHVQDCAFDLRLAEDEVRRRLARIRATLDGDGFPAEPG